MLINNVPHGVAAWTLRSLEWPPSIWVEKKLHQRQFKAQIKWIVQYKYACKRILCNKSNKITIGDIDPMLLSSYS